MPTIEADLEISHGEAGSLFLLTSLGYFISLMCSGFVSAQLNHRRTIMLSAVAVGLVMLSFNFFENIWAIRLDLLLLGLAAGLYLPSGIATLTALVNPQNWGKALAMHEMAPNLGFVLAPLLSVAVLSLFSWKGATTILSVLSFAAVLAFMRFGHGGRFKGQAPSLKAIRSLFFLRSFWIMIFLFSLAIAGSLGIYTMLPLYLITEHGFDQNRANTLVGLSRILGVGAAFASGWASDRFGPLRILKLVLFLSGLFTIGLGLTGHMSLICLVFLQPLVAVCFFPPGFALLSTIGPESSRNLVVSLTAPAAFTLGGGLVPILIGLSGDAGSFASGLVLVGVLILLGLLLIRALPRPDL